MNKYRTITKESKKIQRENLKETFKLLNISNMLNIEKIINYMDFKLESTIKLCSYQIILNKDIFMMDKNNIEQLLQIENINSYDFFNKINLYDTISYLIIDKCLKHLEKNSNENLGSRDKYIASYECIIDINNDIKNKNSYQDVPKETILSDDRISQIDELANFIYENTIKPKITDNEINEKDLINSAYDRKK